MDELITCFPDAINNNYKRSINRLFKQSHNLDIGLVDTSICQPHSLKRRVTPEDSKIIKSVLPYS